MCKFFTIFFSTFAVFVVSYLVWAQFFTCHFYVLLVSNKANKQSKKSIKTSNEFNAKER